MIKHQEQPTDKIGFDLTFQQGCSVPAHSDLLEQLENKQLEIKEMQKQLQEKETQIQEKIMTIRDLEKVGEITNDITGFNFCMGANVLFLFLVNAYFYILQFLN